MCGCAALRRLLNGRQITETAVREHMAASHQKQRQSSLMASTKPARGKGGRSPSNTACSTSALKTRLGCRPIRIRGRTSPLGETAAAQLEPDQFLFVGTDVRVTFNFANLAIGETVPLLCVEETPSKSPAPERRRRNGTATIPTVARTSPTKYATRDAGHVWLDSSGMFRVAQRRDPPLVAPFRR